MFRFCTVDYTVILWQNKQNTSYFKSDANIQYHKISKLTSIEANARIFSAKSTKEGIGLYKLSKTQFSDFDSFPLPLPTVFKKSH